MRRAWLVAPMLLAVAVLGAGQPRLGTDAEREAGKDLYDKLCAQCHGAQGDGRGVAEHLFQPRPRDFTLGLYKIRTTPSGELPTHEDLRDVIREGMPYTGMPAWSELSAEELDQLVYHLKTFNEDFSDPEMLTPAVEIPKPPKFSPESAQLGEQIYAENKCADCHGLKGRGDGKSARTLKTEWGESIRPADLTRRWTFRGGSSREDIYRTFTTGLNGTPMPSYADLLGEEARWNLVDYVYSFSRDEADYATLILASPAASEIDLDRGVALFETATPAFFPVIGQVIEEARHFVPSSNGVEVRAIYDAENVAILLQWSDMSAESTGVNSPRSIEAVPDTGGGSTPPGSSIAPAGAPSGGLPSDAAAIQIPSKEPVGAAKPYFLFGDVRNTADIWFADLAREEGELLIGRGSKAIEPTGTAIPTRATFEHGQWSVIMMRSRRPAEGLAFEEGRFVPIAFSLWDGANGEQGNRRGITSWYHLYLEPTHQESRALPMASYAFLTLLLEVTILGVVRRQHGVPVPPYLSWSEGVKRSEKLNVDIGLSLLGGLVATIAMTIFLYLVMPTLRHSPLDLGAVLGKMLNGGWVLGMATHFILGALVFPLVFVVFFYPRLRGAPWMRGLAWGFLLWLAAELIATPIAHGGVFHASAGGLRAAVGFLVGHLLYGGVLGAVAGSSGPDRLEKA